MLPTSGLQPRLPQPSGHVLADGGCHPASVSSAGPGMRRVSVVIGDGACGDWRMVLWRSGVSHGALRRQCRFAIAHERACPIPGPCSRRPMACRRSVAWCPQLCDALSHVIPCVDPITDSVRCPRTGAGWWLPAPAAPVVRATIPRCCVHCRDRWAGSSAPRPGLRASTAAGPLPGRSCGHICSRCRGPGLSLIHI